MNPAEQSDRPLGPPVHGWLVGWRLSLAALTLTVASAGPALAAEPYRPFLEGLWDRGYGELAVGYVNGQRRRPDLPADLRATIDLDLARSLLIAADEVPGAESATRQRETARTYLEQFKQAHADRPEVATADLLIGGLTLAHGQELLRLAQPLSGESRTSAMDGVRQELEAARSDFAKAVELFSDRLASMPAPPPPAAEAPPQAPVEAKPAHKHPVRPGAKTTSKPSPHAAAKTHAAPAVPPRLKPSPRMLVEEQLAEASLKAVLVDYYTAQTFGEADEFSRQAALKTAAAGFDKVYQLHRMDRTGLVAHLWSGRAEEELGERQTALDIYDEVLGIVPEDSDQHLAPDVFAVLCEAESRRLRLLDKQGDRDAAISEAEQWFEQFPTFKHGPANLEVALELCKLKLAKADAASGEMHDVLSRGAMSLLAEIARQPGPHQAEAVQLWRDYSKAGGPQAKTALSDGLAMAAAAARNRLWDEAITGYERAIAGAHEPGETQQVMSARYELARVQFMAGKLDEALATAEALAGDGRAGDVAPAAALLATRAAWNRLATADSAGKAAAEARVERAARTVFSRWPKSSEADEARLMLARLQITRGDPAGALPLVEAIGPSSELYREALLLAGQTHWRLHLAAARQRPAAGDADEASLRRAISELETLVRLDSSDSTDDSSLSDALHEALVLLAEIHLASNQPAQAAPLADRLTAAIKLRGRRLSAADAAGLALAIKIYVAGRQSAKAGEAAGTLLESGTDERAVNSALVEYVRLLRQSPEPKPPAFEAPANDSAAKMPSLDVLLAKLAGRKEISITDRILLGNICRDLSRQGEAVVFFQSALKQVEQDTTQHTAQQLRAISQLRLLVVDLLRRERRYDEALAEADRLATDNPGVIEPMVDKARVLDDWSNLVPGKLADAVSAWQRVRVALQSLQPKPAEYFDAVYHAADCLFRQARETHEPVHLKQAEQMLKATLVLYPKLHGAEQVEKFQKLLDRIASAPR